MTRPHAALGSARGFTLIELTVVLAITALVLTVVVPRLAGMTGARPFVEAREQAVSALRIARGRAIEQRETTVVAAGRLQAAGDVGVRITPEDGIRFHPDGSSSGGRIVLRSGHREAAITVDWLTGRVRVEE